LPRLITGGARHLAVLANELPCGGDVVLAKPVVLGSARGAAQVPPVPPVQTGEVLAFGFLRVGADVTVLVRVSADTKPGTVHVLATLLPSAESHFCPWTTGVYIVLFTQVVRTTHPACDPLTDSLLTVIALAYTV